MPRMEDTAIDLLNQLGKQKLIRLIVELRSENERLKASLMPRPLDWEPFTDEDAAIDAAAERDGHGRDWDD